MFYHDKRLQYAVKVTTPDPVFARMLQQAIGSAEGEIRVCMQYFFQSWGSRGPNPNYRDILMHTATEEIDHIEMLATAVALNLEKAPTELQEEDAGDGIVGTIIGGGNGRHAIEGMLHRHLLSTGMAAYPANAVGVPFDMPPIYASGNLAAYMYSNVAAESTGRVPAVRLFNATQDPGMKDMLHFMIARDTMHQQQWLAVIEELGGFEGTLPIPNSFLQSQKDQEHNYDVFDTGRRDLKLLKVVGPMVRRWTASALTACSRTSPWARCRTSARRGPTTRLRSSRLVKQQANSSRRRYPSG